MFGILNYITKILEIDLNIKIITYLTFYFLINYYIYIYHEKILNYTNLLLNKFLDSYLAQLFIFLMMRNEIAFLINPTRDIGTIITLYMGAFAMPVSLFLFKDFNLFFQTLIVMLFITLFFWWRFRTSFYNLELLGEDVNIEKLYNKNKLKLPLTWDCYILLFNSYFNNKSKKNMIAFKPYKIQNRLMMSGLPKAFVTLYKHNPQFVKGTGAVLSGGVLAAGGAHYKIETDKIHLEHEAKLREIEKQTQELKLQTLKDVRQSEIEFSQNLSIEASKQRNPEKLNLMIESSQERLNRIDQRLEMIIEKNSYIETTSLNSVLENISLFS